jgi:hypothetical protein
MQWGRFSGRFRQWGRFSGDNFIDMQAFAQGGGLILACRKGPSEALTAGRL